MLIPCLLFHFSVWHHRKMKSCHWHLHPSCKDCQKWQCSNCLPTVGSFQFLLPLNRTKRKIKQKWIIYINMNITFLISVGKFFYCKILFFTSLPCRHNFMLCFQKSYEADIVAKQVKLLLVTLAPFMDAS